MPAVPQLVAALLFVAALLLFVRLQVPVLVPSVLLVLVVFVPVVVVLLLVLQQVLHWLMQIHKAVNRTIRRNLITIMV